MLERLVALNEKSNDLLRKAAVVVVMLGLIAALSLLFPYVAPFVIAACIAAAIEPAVRLLSRMFPRVSFRRTIAAAFCTILVLAILLFVTLALSSRIFSELTSVAATMPRLVSDSVSKSLTWLNGRLTGLELLDDATRSYIQESLVSFGRTLTSSATTIAYQLGRGVWNTATVTVPQILLFITLTFMGTFYFSADRERIQGFLSALAPVYVKRNGVMIKANLLKGLVSQIRAGLILLVVTFAELTIGFSLVGMDYVLLTALVISVLDALPILGTGLFLLPMSIYGLFTGNFRMGVGLILLYLIIGIVRQTIEPRIVGRNMGLHPLATMMAMYASYKAIGLGGMILGPIILLLCKVIVELTSSAPQEDGAAKAAAASAQPAPITVREASPPNKKKKKN